MAPKTKASNVKFSELPPSFQQSGYGPYINLLQEHPPLYLENYRNPCWKEELTSIYPYSNNSFCQGKHYVQETFKHNSLYLEASLRAGQPWHLRCLPYFYLAGFVKCGTTEIFFNIRNHPMVAKSYKEIHWWNSRRNGHKIHEGAAVPIRDYIDLFDKVARTIERLNTSNSTGRKPYHPMIIGDGTTLTVSQQQGWSVLPENKGRQLGKDEPRYINAHYIRHVTPQARIIVSMRDPANRVYSHYTMNHGIGPEDFHTKVEATVNKMKTCITKNGLFACCVPQPPQKFYLSDSIYYAHIARWLKVFPTDQFHFVKLEEYSANRVSGLNQIFEFLELEPLAADVLEEKTYHIKVGCETCTLLPMLNRTRTLLDEFFHPYNVKLADLLNDKRWLFK